MSPAKIKHKKKNTRHVPTPTKIRPPAAMLHPVPSLQDAIPPAPVEPPKVATLLRPVGRNLAQWAAVYATRARLGHLERKVFDAILEMEKGRPLTLRELAAEVGSNIRIVHETLNRLEDMGCIKCPKDVRGHRASYWIADRA